MLLDRFLAEILHVDDFGQFSQLLDDLLDDLVFARHGDRDTRGRGILCGSHGQGFDIVTPAGKHAADACQYARVILNQAGDQMLMGLIHCLGFSRPDWVFGSILPGCVQ